MHDYIPHNSADLIAVLTSLFGISVYLARSIRNSLDKYVTRPIEALTKRLTDHEKLAEVRLDDHASRIGKLEGQINHD